MKYLTVLIIFGLVSSGILAISYITFLSILYFETILGFAHLTCQVCGDVGLCQNAADNGVAKECPTETDVCFYSENRKSFFICKSKHF